MKKRLIPLLIFLFTSFASYAQEQQKLLSQKDVTHIMQEILQSHLEVHELTPDRIRQSFLVYIDEFDLTRVYLLEEEIAPYRDLSDARAEAVLHEYRRGHFAAYTGLNHVIQKSIERARNIRQTIEQEEQPPPPSFVPLSFSEKQKRPFAKNQEELEERIRNDWYQFLEKQKKIYGPNIVTARKKNIVQLYNEGLQRHENAYFYQTAEGRRLRKEEEENFFSLHLLKALAQTLDRNTEFFGPEEALDIQIYLEKEYSGVGLIFEKRLDGLSIVDIIPNSPAANSEQIQVGDILQKINGQPVSDKDIQEAVRQLRGPIGTFVDLSFSRPSTQKEWSVHLERGEVEVQKDRIAISEEPFGKGMIGKIALHSFYKGEKGSSVEDVQAALETLNQKNNLIGLVLDLRENSGGFLSEAIKVAGLFINSGIIVVSKETSGDTVIFRDFDPQDLYDGPLVILTSQETASAAEIVAQALRDYGVAIIVGDESTFGKGTLQTQTITDNDTLSLFKVTVGKYYTVGGESPEEKGVPIDIVISRSERARDGNREWLEISSGQEKIPPQFIDTLEDIPLVARGWFMQYYLPRVQKPSQRWRKNLSSLQKNSQLRLEKDRNYQLYLRGALPDKEDDLLDGWGEEVEKKKSKNDYGTDDIVLEEAVNIVKDMILLQNP